MRSTAILLLLCGCASVNPVTLYRLNQLDPLTADPADIAVQFEFPEGVDVMPDGARLSLTGQRGDTGETLNGAFILAREGKSNPIFTITPDDAVTMREMQSTANQWKREAERGSSGHFSVAVTPCIVGNGPEKGATVSMFVKMGKDAPFVPLIRNGPLSAVADDVDISDIAFCP